nr:MAG TPA: hypothetical protein [Caudoviricetes sp.]
MTNTNLLKNMGYDLSGDLVAKTTEAAQKYLELKGNLLEYSSAISLTANNVRELDELWH